MAAVAENQIPSDCEPQPKEGIREGHSQGKAEERLAKRSLLGRKEGIREGRSQRKA